MRGRKINPLHIPPRSLSPAARAPPPPSSGEGLAKAPASRTGHPAPGHVGDSGALGSSSIRQAPAPPRRGELTTTSTTTTSAGTTGVPAHAKEQGKLLPRSALLPVTILANLGQFWPIAFLGGEPVPPASRTSRRRPTDPPLARPSLAPQLSDVACPEPTTAPRPLAPTRAQPVRPAGRPELPARSPVAPRWDKVQVTQLPKHKNLSHQRLLFLCPAPSILCPPFPEHPPWLQSCAGISQSLSAAAPQSPAGKDEARRAQSPRLLRAPSVRAGLGTEPRG